MKLVICDVDRTLVNAFPVHKTAIQIVMEQVFNKKNCSWEEVDYAGKTIEQNLKDLCKVKKIPGKELQAKEKEATKLYDKAFLEAINNKPITVLPGVPKFLAALSKHKNIFLAIVSGSSAEIVHAMLNKADLLSYFHVIVAGDNQTDRKEMVRSAIQLAELQAKQKFKKIFIIGDSIHDIDSGKPFKAVTIGILTGPHNRTQLQKHDADYVFKDVRDPKLLEVLTT